MDTDCETRIAGWITPRLERLLRRAAAAAEHGYDYLGVEHLALALTDDPDSLPAGVWTSALTIDQWRQAILNALPPQPAPGHRPAHPVTITTRRPDRPVSS